jgi:septal ring factor EnvC (AmiA/AmiB activator)
MEEQFRKMNEDKVKELKKRIEDTQAESIRLKREISQSESKLKKTTEDLGVLESRLSSFNEKEPPNGYVFFVSDEQKPKETGLTEENRAVADKIADILGLKKEALFKMLTQCYYTIKIAEKDNLTADEVEVKSEVMNKILLMVLSDKSGDAKVSQVSSTEYEYRGSLTWHQLVQKMISLGFEQDPQFDILCNSNSYKSLEEEKNDDSTEI